MRHLRQRRKLGVTTKHRKALLRNLVRSLVIRKRIQTTVAKAKEASAFADRMVEMAKRGDIHARRTLISKLGCPDTVDTLIKKIAPRFKERKGGYTRVLKLSRRRPGDQSEMALLEFTTLIEEPSKPKKPKKAPKSKQEDSTAAAKPKKTKQTKADSETKPMDKTPDDKKESEKKGGFLGALRKFLKGDE